MIIINFHQQETTKHYDKCVFSFVRNMATISFLVACSKSGGRCIFSLWMGKCLSWTLLLTDIVWYRHMDLVRLKWNLVWSYYYLLKGCNNSNFRCCFLNVVTPYYMHLDICLVWFWTFHNSDVGLVLMTPLTFKFHGGVIEGRNQGRIYIKKCYFGTIGSLKYCIKSWNATA